MENYKAPEKDGENRKRNKTGYNMFFSAYVLQLKQSAAGVPPERGSVARLVGHAWKVSSLHYSVALWKIDVVAEPMLLNGLKSLIS